MRSINKEPIKIAPSRVDFITTKEEQEALDERVQQIRGKRKEA